MASPSLEDASWLFLSADDDNEDDSPLDFETVRPIPRVHVVASLDYGTEVVQLFAAAATTAVQQLNSTTHAPSVQMSGCGASVHLLQPNNNNGAVTTTSDNNKNEGKMKAILGSGAVVWGCAPAMCTVLSGSANCFANDHTTSNVVDFSNKVILELGAGTGALGLWIASKWPTATVILTDLPDIMENLRENIAANQLSSQCTASELVFGDSVASGVDYIVASDCQFSTSAEFMWKPFVATLASAAPDTQVFISLQERYGTSGERLEPFLNALGDLAARPRTEQCGTSAIPSSANGDMDENSSCGFVELLHPSLGHGSQYYDAEYPNRCFHLSL